jgi:hypothetical protein
MRERRGVLPGGRVAALHRALVPQHLQPRAFDQGARDRHDAQGDPRRRGHRSGQAEGVQGEQIGEKSTEFPCAEAHPNG